MRLDNIKNCFKLSESRTLLTLKMAKHATDRLIIQFDPISSKGVIASIAKDYCTWSKLSLISISISGPYPLKASILANQKRNSSDKAGESENEQSQEERA